MPTILRTFIAGCAAALVLAGGPAMAQQYPSKPIRLVVPFAPGGLTDLFGRLVGEVLSERLGVPVVVDNRTGAGGNIGSDLVAKAAPDGYTLLLGGAGHLVISPALYSHFPFDPVKDLAPVTLVGSAMNVLVVHPSVPAANVKEFVAYAKAHPGKLNYASGGIGAIHHLAGEMFSERAGVKMIHVPYRGGSLPAHTDLIAGRVQVMFDTLPNILPHIRSGKVRAIAVTGAQRSPDLADIPTVIEQGLPGFEVSGWWGVLAPGGTPPALVQRLHRELAAGMPGMSERVRRLGAEPALSTPAEFSVLIKQEIQKWGAVVKATGAKLD